MQPSVGPWPHGLLTASSSGFSSYEKVTTPVKKNGRDKRLISEFIGDFSVNYSDFNEDCLL